jgi:fucose 4-O-acetylase-like acetyltransferase
MKYFEIGLAYPYIVGIPGVFWGNFWLCLLMGVSGSLALFVICQKIGKCRWLEYLGRHTLTIYLLQESIMGLLIKSYVHWQVTIPRVIAVVFVIFSTAFICAWVDVFINKHLCFLKGKF